MDYEYDEWWWKNVTMYTTFDRELTVALFKSTASSLSVGGWFCLAGGIYLSRQQLNLVCQRIYLNRPEYSVHIFWLLSVHSLIESALHLQPVKYIRSCRYANPTRNSLLISWRPLYRQPSRRMLRPYVVFNNIQYGLIEEGEAWFSIDFRSEESNHGLK